MDKRRKSAYIEYNYEAAYQKKLHNLEEVNAEKMLKEGKVKSLYATKEIRAGGATGSGNISGVQQIPEGSDSG